MDDEREESYDTMTPLDSILDRIGMGYYQWSLLGLCGFGANCSFPLCACFNWNTLHPQAGLQIT